MAKFKRNKPKKQVRCTLCTPYKWMGNSKDRHRHSTNKKRQIADEKLRDPNFYLES